MDIDLTLIDRIKQGPEWIYWWTRVIDWSNWALLSFVYFDKRARWAFLAWLVNIVIIIALYNVYGYIKILGLSHMLVWSGLLVYLLRNRQPFVQENWSGKYLYWFMAVISVSLVFDYVDVFGYLVGLV